MASRGEWLAENQQIFRDANERLNGLTEDRVESGTQVPLILPGHDTVELEEVVERNGGFLVVRKG